MDHYTVGTDNQNAIYFSNDFSEPKYETAIPRIGCKSPHQAVFQYKRVIVTCKIIVIPKIIYHSGTEGREYKTIKKTIVKVFSDNY